MSFSYFVDGTLGVEGWIDRGAARDWAREASRLFRRAREQTSLADYKREYRAGLEALTHAYEALNLPASQTPERELSQAWPYGVDSLDRWAGDELSARVRAAASAQYPRGLQSLADSLALGDYPQTAPDGTQWVLRVGPSIVPDDPRNVPTPMPASADVLAYLRGQVPTQWEQRAAAIERDPVAHYADRRSAIDARNAQTARLWGLTTPEQIRGFQVASDAVNATMGAEWESAQKAAVKAQADRILDQASQYAASTGVGAPLAAVFQAVKLLTGILPWATVEAPPPALSRTRTGGVGPADTQRPTHRVPLAPSELTSTASSSSATLTGDASFAPGLRRMPALEPRRDPTTGGVVLEPRTDTTGGAVQGLASTPSGSSSTYSSHTGAGVSPGVIGGVVVAGAAIVYYFATRKQKRR